MKKRKHSASAYASRIHYPSQHPPALPPNSPSFSPLVPLLLLFILTQRPSSPSIYLKKTCSVSFSATWPNCLIWPAVSSIKSLSVVDRWRMDQRASRWTDQWQNSSISKWRWPVMEKGNEGGKEVEEEENKLNRLLWQRRCSTKVPHLDALTHFSHYLCRTPNLKTQPRSFCCLL